MRRHQTRGETGYGPASREKMEALGKRLAAYSAAAAAAGLGLLGTAQPAKADIIYTPANIGFSGSLVIDINHDGFRDVKLYNSVPGDSTEFLFVRAYPILNHGAGVLGGPPLYRGATIGPGAGGFFTFGRLATLRFSRSTFFGSWADVTNRYLGLRLSFGFGGGIHYGWAELSAGHKGCCDIVARLEGYAYDTVANQTIGAGQIGPNTFSSAPTPEPGTLGLLALGSLGLGFWRRKKAQTSEN